MKDLFSLQGAENEKGVLIVGAGSTIRDTLADVQSCIQDQSLATIGINNMTAAVIPKYHVWTNAGRLREFGSCIRPESILVIKKTMDPALLREYATSDTVALDYKDAPKYGMGFKGGMIKGHFRTAGCLAIMLAQWMGAARIFIAGMDGYTLHSREAVESGKETQHMYGTGLTDKNKWEYCVEKDSLIYSVLRSIWDFGVSFSIITPTVYKEFYDPSVLGG